MAVTGDKFKKRRDLVQKPAVPPSGPRRPAANPIKNGGRPLDWIGDGGPPPSVDSLMSQMPRRGFVNGYVPPVQMPRWGTGEPERTTPTFQEQYRIDHGMNPYNADFIQGVDDKDEDGNPIKDGGLQYLANNGPSSRLNPSRGGASGDWGPQGQAGVLSRAAAALEAVQLDRQGYQPPLGISNGPGLDMTTYTTPQNIGTDTQYAGGIRGGGASRSRVTPNPIYGGASGGWDPADGTGATGEWGSGLAASPQFPQGVGPLRSLGRSGSQMLGNHEQAAEMRGQAGGMWNAAAKIDGMVRRSQFANPLTAYRDESADSMAESNAALQRNMDFIQTNPRPRTSIDSAGMSRDAFDRGTSGLANRYNGRFDNPMDLDSDQKLKLAEQSAGRYMEGGAAADPTNMRGRFGGVYGMGLEADATSIRDGKAVRTADGKVVYHTGTQESARRAQLAGKSDREALRDRNNMNVPQAELDRRAAADAQEADRAAKHQAFKDANGGLNYRQYDRLQGSSHGNNALTMKAVREGRLSPAEATHRMQTRADKALRRSGNPMAMGTDASRKLFPDLTNGANPKQTQAGPNPLSEATDAMRPNGIVTPNSSALARNTLKVLGEGGKSPDGTVVPPSPMFAGLADSPDNIQGVHFGIQQMVQDGQDLGPDDLQKLHAAAVAMQSGYGTSSYDPFDMTHGLEGLSGLDAAHTKTFGPMYKQLAEMGAPTPEALQGWWQSFKGNIAPPRDVFNGVYSDESFWGHEYPKNPMK